MGRIVSAHAWANNEVAYIAWDIDDTIANCLGFDVVRVYLNNDDTVAIRPDGAEDRVSVASWVAFEGQRNPHQLPQDSSVWPVQKISWRDLTLRKKRDGMTRRPDEVRVRYDIRPLGPMAPGLEAVPPNGREFQFIPKKDAQGHQVFHPDGRRAFERVRAYEGNARPLAYIDAATSTNSIHVTKKRGPFISTFTNGILAAQWLKNVLNEDGVIENDELITKLKTPGDVHRNYLAGDVIPLVREFLSRAGEFFLSLYELEDRELQDLLIANASRLHVILSNTGVKDGVWDVRNHDARQELIAAGVDIQHRMFNNSIHIGHNKFVVHVPPGGAPRSVLTGSTNWTSTGVAAQTNNVLVVEDDAVAGVFIDYWNRLKADVIVAPATFGSANNTSRQGQTIRTANATSNQLTLANGATLDIWFAPNRPERQKPSSTTHPPPTPPDLAEVYRRMRLAQDIILFLAFYPAQRGKDCIIGEAIQIGLHDPTLLIAGAVSSAQAMPNYVPSTQGDEGEEGEAGESPSTFDQGNVSIVRAARIDDRTLLGDFGREVLTPNNGIGAIIHDKLIVIDPRSDNCSVVLGSHNLGFKASYSNDENFLIVGGDKALAAAYAVHILDVYDHYRFRAIQSDRAKQGKPLWSGFLETDTSWQTGYVNHTKGAIMRYFAG